MSWIYLHRYRERISSVSGPRAPRWHSRFLFGQTAGSLYSSEEAEGIMVLDFLPIGAVPVNKSHVIWSITSTVTTNRDRAMPMGCRSRLYRLISKRRIRGKTETFIEKTGIRLVLDDPGGKVLGQLGGKALPYIVILKSIRGSSNTRWRIPHGNSLWRLTIRGSMK